MAICNLLIKTEEYFKKRKDIFIVLFLLVFFTNSYSEFNYMKYIELQQNMGPRIPGSVGHKKFLDYVLKRYKNVVIDTEFVSVKNTIINKDISMPVYNIVISKGKKDSKKIFISAHYDTRLYSDHDPSIEKQKWPLPGANDGASGVAVLMGLMDKIDFSKLDFGIDFIFFDMEDQGRYDIEKSFCLGSQIFAPKNYMNYVWGINLDMVGDANLNISYERISYESSPKRIMAFFEIARKKFGKIFDNNVKYSMYDDHVPFIKYGVPVIELIDFDYKYWHTIQDTKDKLSNKSLNIVGEAVEDYLYSN